MKRVLIIAAATFAAQLATATIYGYHRDEFYYLAQGRRLAWGYVDNPPLTPLLYRAGTALFGTSVLGMRVAPALMHGCFVVLVALIARELGGDDWAAFLAAVGAAVAPGLLLAGHFLSTVSVELVAAAAVWLFFVRLLRTRDPRWWLAVGATVGLGLQVKWTIGFLVVGLVAGLLATHNARGLLWNRYSAAGAAIAAVVAAPNVIWQAQHDWAQLSFAAHLRDYGNTAKLLPFQVIALGGAAFLLALPGLRWLLRDEDGRRFRALAVAYGVMLLLVAATGGKEYYAAAAVPMLLAAGGCAVAIGSHASWRLPVAIVATTLVFAPFAVPLLPLSTANSVRGVNKEIGEMVGWEHYVDVVARVAAAHPGAPILTSNYSEAGAIELLGPKRGMHGAVSGHLTYWYWGHPHGTSATTIVVGYPKDWLDQYFGDVHAAATVNTPAGVHNEEDGTVVWVCRAQSASWDAMWPHLRHE